MSEILILKPGETLLAAVRKGMAVVVPADDQPSFREHMHSEGDKAVLQGPLRPAQTAVAVGVERPKAGAQPPPEGMMTAPVFEPSDLPRMAHETRDFRDVARQIPLALLGGSPENPLEKMHIPRRSDVENSRALMAVGVPDLEVEHGVSDAAWSAPLPPYLAAAGAAPPDVTERVERPEAGARPLLAGMMSMPAFHENGLSDTLHTRQPWSTLHEGSPDNPLENKHLSRDSGDVEIPAALGGVVAGGVPEVEAHHVAAASRPVPLPTDVAVAAEMPPIQKTGKLSALEHGPARRDDAQTAPLGSNEVAQRVGLNAGLLSPLQNRSAEHSGIPEPSVRPLLVPSDGVPKGNSAVFSAHPPLEKSLEDAPLLAHVQGARSEVILDRKQEVSALPGVGSGAASGKAEQAFESPPSFVSGSMAPPKNESRLGDLHITMPTWILSDGKASAPPASEHPQARSRMPLSSPVPSMALQTFYAALNDPELRGLVISGPKRDSGEDGVPVLTVPVATAEEGLSRLRLPTSQQLAPLIWAQIRGAIENSTAKSVQIQLQPLELGRVRVTINPTDAGVQVIIFAERPETLELMRKFSAGFERDLKDLGYDGLDMSFSHQQSTDHPVQKRLRADEPDQLSEGALPAAPMLGAMEISARTGMDIRV